MDTLAGVTTMELSVGSPGRVVEFDPPHPGMHNITQHAISTRLNLATQPNSLNKPTMAEPPRKYTYPSQLSQLPLSARLDASQFTSDSRGIMGAARRNRAAQ